jgi:antitoxin (DNA-binding transcriptional repressor) of toxin-antitoxin stability system
MAEAANIHHVKAHFSSLCNSAHAGQDIILIKYRKPYARLVPLEKRPRGLGFVPGPMDDRFFEPLSRASCGRTAAAFCPAPWSRFIPRQRIASFRELERQVQVVGQQRYRRASRADDFDLQTERQLLPRAVGGQHR